jgi:sulfur relay (sulfurtransferase) DsrF/TusC family protein
MKKIFFSGFIIMLSFAFVFAQEDKEEKVPAGMEVLKVGATNVLVPAGTKITKKDGLIILENTAEYTGRRIYVVEKELAEMKAKQEELVKEVERLKKILEEMQNKSGINIQQQNQTGS